MFFLVKMRHGGVCTQRIREVCFPVDDDSEESLQEKLDWYQGKSCKGAPWADDKVICDGNHEVEIIPVTKDNTVSL